jgi:hypothetical protein
VFWNFPGKICFLSFLNLRVFQGGVIDKKAIKSIVNIYGFVSKILARNLSEKSIDI